MGKQIELFTTDDDLVVIEQYLTNKYTCRYFQFHAKKREDIEIAGFIGLNRQYNKIIVWNTDFPWEIEVGLTQQNDPWYYIVNDSTGPVFELTKSNIEQKRPGRIYWSKRFLSSNLSYDVEKYELYYNDIIKWIKNICAGKDDNGQNHYTYYMENAWKLLKAQKA